MDKIERVLRVLLANERTCMRLYDQHRKEGKEDLARFEMAEAVAVRSTIYLLTDDDYLADLEDIYGGDQK